MTALVVIMTFVGFALPHVLSSRTEQPVIPAQAFPSVADRSGFVRVNAERPADVSAAAAGVWDPASRSFLFEKNIHESFPIASMTKLMTALLVVEQGVDLDADAVLTSEDNDPAGSHVALPVGSVVTVRDLLAASLIASGNNAAEALARASGMREPAFVQAMNDHAAELGMARTRFTDTTGLGAGNRSTVRDIMVLMNAAFSNEEIANVTARQNVTVRIRPSNRDIVLKTTNRLLASDLNVTAGKTGTSPAGIALGVRVRHDAGHDVFIAVLGSAGDTERFSDARALAGWAFRAFRFY